MDPEHATTTLPDVATGVDDDALVSLRRWNLGLTVLHAAQAVVVLVLANGFAITVTSTFPQGPPGSTPPRPGGAVRRAHRRGDRGLPVPRGA